ncbi:hypothetical protein D9757_014788 [Collybiopsis confluens]|uniref:DUF6830 domain-containing protein n=1 Tax=Collybiopsis confluens TaxID=2823264 RepID=A0A8H5CGY3_9AGAR|nr:hypothetical protein D9757_014788 [Collybiopsis confluens]
MPTEFLCPVPTCHRSFAKPGDRERHIKAKQDNAHREQYQRQMKAQADRVSSTINRLDWIAGAHHANNSTSEGLYSKHVGTNDYAEMDIDHIIADERSQALGLMDVDGDGNDGDKLDAINLNRLNDILDDVDDDDDGCESLCSLPQDGYDSVEDAGIQTDNDKDNKSFKQVQDENSEKDTAMIEGFTGNILLSNYFDFLPPQNLSWSSDMSDVGYSSDLDSNLDHGSNSSANSDIDDTSSSNSAIAENPDHDVYRNRNMARTLVENNDDEPRTWWWHPTAGRVIGHEASIFHHWKTIFSKQEDQDGNVNNNYYPFVSSLDWKVAEWAVREKISQKSFDLLLRIPQVQNKLGLSYTNSKSMLEYIDAIPNRCGIWYTKELSFRDSLDEKFTVHHRDPVQAIKALWGDPAFADHLVYKPGKLFYGNKQTENFRMFSEIWTAGFWNAIQGAIPDGGTVCPVIIASDKTNLTRFSGNKSAYPVYLTIGNLPKAMRRKPSARACILIAYLSVEKPNKKGLTKNALKIRNYEIFHKSMAHVLEPLKLAGNPDTGGIKMTGGDGAIRMVFPILCSYIADYPEQCLVTCTKYGACPKCKRPANELEFSNMGEPRTQAWTIEKINEAKVVVSSIDNKSKAKTKAHSYAMKTYDIAGGIKPFWADFPLTDIHKCITPDILHQCYQGVFKYLIAWIKDIVGENELDARLQTLPPAHGIRHFKKGIADFSQITGAEHKQMACVLLPCLVGKVDSKGIRACRSLLNFIYLAQYSIHDQETLGYMDAELKIWHKNRNYFIKEKMRSHFNIPKFHSLQHYIDAIKWLGTTDNYNTEAFERYHIDMAKHGWEASNKRDHFPQMTQWLTRQEKVLSYDFYRNWVDSIVEEEPTEEKTDLLKSKVNENILVYNGNAEEYTSLQHNVNLVETHIKNRFNFQSHIQIAKHPQESKKSLNKIVDSHNAPGFILALKSYLNSLLPINLQATSKADIGQAILPFTSLHVWHQYKFAPAKLLYDDSDISKEIVKAIPVTKKTPLIRHDTVIVMANHRADSTTIKGCRVAQVKVIFQLPEVVQRFGMQEPSPLNWPHIPLAYVAWFSHFKSQPSAEFGMYTVKPSVASNGIAQGAIIPLSDIRQTCMLTPNSSDWDSTWTSDNVLDKCQFFFVNNLQSKYTYQTVY